ncbi:MAG: choice-of-anchor tandem repeat GloVer-containing protein, partial [Opitutaceae bacterium]
MAFKIGYTDSAVTSGTYTVTLPTITSQPQVTSFAVLHTFTGMSNNENADGAFPRSGLIQGTDGRLYGTAPGGGQHGPGTVFAMNPDGSGFTTLHSFSGGTVDCGSPQAGLVQGSDGRLYGTASGGGGTYNDGAVFVVNPDGTGYSILYSFTGGSDGADPQGSLIQGTDGRLYGTTNLGGANGDGAVFAIDPKTKNFTALYSFSSNAFGTNADGANPLAGLIQQGTAGLLYGTTSGGGPNGAGTLFAVNPNVIGSCTVIYPFMGGSDGGHSRAGLIQGADGRLYGTTPNGGANGEGTVFSVNTTGSVFTTLFSFPNAADGANPVAGLVQGTDGQFYGTAENGGAAGAGTVFAVNPGKIGVAALLYSFTGGNDGSVPVDSLVQGTDGRFYGTAQNAGANSDGTIFAISTQNTAIAGSTVTLSVSATGTGSLSYQWKLNGATISGATNPTLVLSNVNASNGGNYTVVVSNSAGSVTSSPVPVAVSALAPVFNPPAGTYTQSVKITSATNGALIAYTTDGSTPTEVGATVTHGSMLSNGGIVAISGSTTLKAIAFEAGFADSTVTSGSYANAPVATNQSVTTAENAPVAITLSATGINSDQLVYSVANPPAHGTLQGTGKNLTYTPAANFFGTDRFTFTANDNGAVSSAATVSITVTKINYSPVASSQLVTAAENIPLSITLVATQANNEPLTYTIASQPAHGTLGGVAPDLTYTPAINYTGTDTFTFTASCDGMTSNTATITITVLPSSTPSLNVIYNFTGSNNGGVGPDAALVQGSDGYFYGTTMVGGSSNDGTVFKTTPAGALTTLVSFTGPNGAQPMAGLIEGTDGNFYGTTDGGGSSNDGTVFKTTPAGVLTTLVSFNGINGAQPMAALVEGTDGNFYGTTAGGGSNADGTVFQITSTGALTTLVSFNGTNGSDPNGLVRGSDGNFYGTTQEGGSGGYGTLYKISPAGILTTLVSFDGVIGDAPLAALVQGTDGNFYGTTSGQDFGDYGTVFMMTPAGTLTFLASFNGANGDDPSAALVQGSDGNFYGTT